ncbi:MAG: hypothetical protein V1702_04395 [Candidatus Woesearchaeota archaeon]
MKLDRDTIIIPAIIFLLLWFGIGALWGHEIEHGFPYGLGASDAFQHQARAESIKEMGGYAHEAPYIVNGFTDVVGFYPPLLYHLSALLSNVTGLQTYDTIYFIVFLSAVLAAAAMYLVIKHFNSNAAILGIPLFVFLFSAPFTAAYLWGQWPSAASHVFLVAAVWALVVKGRLWWLFSGIFMAAVGMTHTSEMIFLIGFFSIYGAAKLLMKDWREVKELLALALTAVVSAGYYLLIFQGTWARFQKYNLFQVERTTESFPTIMLSHFSWAAIIIAIGAVIALLAARKLPVAFSAYMFLAGMTNYVGMSFRAFQTRFFWPVYLAVFFGLGFSAVASLFAKRFRLAISVAAALILSVAVASTSQMMGQSQGMMDQSRWAGLQWLSRNTPEGSTVYFFYGDIYSQTSMLYNTGRLSTIVNTDDYIKGLMNNTIRERYESMLASDSGAGFPYKKGLFSFGFHTGNMTWEQNASICSKDYFVFDTKTAYSQMSPLVQYNLAIREKLLMHGEEVYSNSIVSIVKNNLVEGDCLEI